MDKIQSYRGSPTIRFKINFAPIIYSVVGMVAFMNMSQEIQGRSLPNYFQIEIKYILLCEIRIFVENPKSKGSLFQTRINPPLQANPHLTMQESSAALLSTSRWWFSTASADWSTCLGWRGS